VQFDDTLAYLQGLQRFGMKPGLARTEELLRRLGRPDRQVGRVVHITGTSGKGSVSALVEAGLRAAGFKVGLYTSPSLERFTERIQINRHEIDPVSLCDLTQEVQPHVAAMVADGFEQPTEFEVTTAIAFLYFARKGIDWLVLEVGLGGRFDATAIIEHPVATCITNIGLDHMEFLGHTHKEIAWDKAGIIKPGAPCVTATDHPEALEVIRQVGLENSAPVQEVRPSDYQVRHFGPAGQRVDLLGARGLYQGVELALLGPHQAQNACLALRLLELCGVKEEAIRAGFAKVEWPGRFERIPLKGGPIALLDGAHNPAKCQALATAVKAYFPGHPVVLLLGALADKDVEAMIPPLLGLASSVVTVTPHSPRKLEGAELAKLARHLRPGLKVITAESIEQGVQQALVEAGTVQPPLGQAGPAPLILVTGSFAVVGPARKRLVEIASSRG
jgi:dihydrofolate synthase/folylpolyglutamate synthase